MGTNRPVPDEILQTDAAVRPRLIEMVGRIPGATTTAILAHLRLDADGNKFGWYMVDHHGDGRVDLHCKAAPGVAQILIESKPTVFHTPAYVARYGWVGIYLDGPDLPWDEIEDVLNEAAKLAKPARKKR